MPRPPSTYDGRTTTGKPIARGHLARFLARRRGAARRLRDARGPDSSCRRTAGDPPRDRSNRATCRGSGRRPPAARSASLSGVCPPNCTRHDTSPPAARSRLDDRHHVLERQRLEVEPVGRVVVGRDRLGIAVDHHRLEALFAEREGRVTAAVVELDALADPVRPAAEDDDLRSRRSDSASQVGSYVLYRYGVNDSNSAAQVSTRL